MVLQILIEVYLNNIYIYHLSYHDLFSKYGCNEFLEFDWLCRLAKSYIFKKLRDLNHRVVVVVSHNNYIYEVDGVLGEDILDIFEEHSFEEIEEALLDLGLDKDVVEVLTSKRQDFYYSDLKGVDIYKEEGGRYLNLAVADPIPELRKALERGFIPVIEFSEEPIRGLASLVLYEEIMYFSKRFDRDEIYIDEFLDLVEEMVRKGFILCREEDMASKCRYFKRQV